MATKPAAKTPAKSRRTKMDNELQFEALESEIGAREATDAKTAASIAAHESAVQAAVSGINMETVITRIGALGLDVSRSLSDLSEKLTGEVRLLATLQEAVGIERRALEKLHQIDIAATAIDQLLSDHAEHKASFDREIAEERGRWQSEADKVERDRREQEEALKKQRQREIEDYEYKKALERKKAQDKADEELRQLERKNAERQEALEKDWQRRELGLKEREEHIASLQAEIAGFPARLARDVELAAETARQQTEAKLDREMLLIRKDAEAETRVAQLNIKTLEQALAQSALQVAALERQVVEAKQQVQDIAVRAIDGASGARALGHINQIAMEQAKNRPQG
jgi:colicin import membrane protein